MDFVENKGSKPFEALVKLTIKDPRQVSAILGDSPVDKVETYSPSRKNRYGKNLPRRIVR